MTNVTVKDYVPRKRKTLRVEDNADTLTPYFKKVQDPNDWRNEIGPIWINADELQPINQAVSFFTATALNIIDEDDKGKILVWALGYRNGPAGP